MIRGIIGVVAFALPSLAVAQSTMVVAPPSNNAIHAGTAIQLETRDELSTEGKHLTPGKLFDLDVLQPVMLGDKVAIPAGSRAVGEVVTVRNKGMWGKSGGIIARVLYVEANGRQIRLNGTFNNRGETGTAGVVASVAFVPVAGFFVTGTSAKIATGTHVTAFIAEEVAVQFADAPAAPAPMVVATAPAPVPAKAPTTPVAAPAVGAPAAAIPAAVPAAGVPTEGGTVTKPVPTAS